MSYKLAITKKTLQEYLNILPIGYYLGAKVECEADNTSTSYFDLTNGKIVISVKQLNELKYNEKPSDEQIEKDIRCMLYHEVSHAILTPKEEIIIRKDILNVFEDERIETLLSGFYKKVNFKEFVKRINNFNEETFIPQDAYQLFYGVVRFRVGPEWLVLMVNEIIYRARFITSKDTVHWTNGRFGDYYNYKSYQSNVYNLWMRCEQYFNNNKDEYQKTTGKGSSFNENMEEEIIIAQSPTPSSEEKELKEKEELMQDDNKKIRKDYKEHGYTRYIERGEDTQFEDFCRERNINATGFTLDLSNYVKAVLKQKGEAFPEFRKQLKKIIMRYKGTQKQNGGSRLAYSGRIDPRLTINNDFKWFVKNGGNTIKRGAKFQLNLFIDVSGSFTANQRKTNSILAELEKLEKEMPNEFEYNVVTMNNTIQILSKNNRRIDCCGGTNLSIGWKKIINKVQNPSNDCFNIVLFDGKCYSKSNKDLFKIFNRNNFIIIAEEGNRPAINQYCKNTRKNIIVKEGDNYNYYLASNILKVLNMAIR